MRAVHAAAVLVQLFKKRLAGRSGSDEPARRKKGVVSQGRETRSGRPMTRSKPPPSLSAKFFETVREEEVSDGETDSSESESDSESETDSSYDSDDSSDSSSDEETCTDDDQHVSKPQQDDPVREDKAVQQERTIQKLERQLQVQAESPTKTYPSTEQAEPNPIPDLEFKEIMPANTPPPRPEGWLEYTDLTAPGKAKWELGYFVAGPVTNLGLGKEGSAQASRVVANLGKQGRLVCYKDRKAADDDEDQGLKGKDWPLSGMNVLYKEMNSELKRELYRDSIWSKRWQECHDAANPATGKIKKDILEALLKKLHPKVATAALKAAKTAGDFMKRPAVLALTDEESGLIQVYDPFSFKFWLSQEEGLVGMELRCGCADVAEAWIRTLRQWQYYHLCTQRERTPLWSSSDVHMACAVFCGEDELAKRQLLRLCKGAGQGKKKIDGTQLRLLADCDAIEHTSQHLDTLMDGIVEEARLPDSEKKARRTQKIYIFNLARALGDAARAGHVAFDDLPESGGKPGYPFVAPTVDIESGFDPKKGVGTQKGLKSWRTEKEDKTRYTIFAQQAVDGTIPVEPEPEPEPEPVGGTITVEPEPGTPPARARNLRNWNALYYFDAYLGGLHKQCDGKSTLRATLKTKPKFPASRHTVGQTTPEERQQGLKKYFRELSVWATKLRDGEGFAPHGVHHVAAFLMPAAGMTIPEEERVDGVEDWFPVVPEPEPEPEPEPAGAAGGGS